MRGGSLLARHGAAWMNDAWYRRACLFGPQALALLAVALIGGMGAAPPTPPPPAEWVHPNSKGRFEAMRTLAAQAKTDAAAAALLKEKATAGDPFAQFFMGVSSDPTFDRAAATAERTAATEDWYRKAAEQGMSLAQANLGHLLAYERFGHPPDYAEAFRWLQLAAQNVPMAQRELGVLYRYGRGVPADPMKAMELIRQAAEHNDPGAEAMLADALDHGSDGLVVDHGEAVRLLQKAAMANNSFAQRRLAIHLRDGDGIAADPAKARYWFTRAAANGDGYAKAQVEVGQADKEPPAGSPSPRGARGAITPFSFAPTGR